MTGRPDPAALLTLLDRVESLPVLAEHHLLLSAALEDDSVTLEDAAMLLERDPSLAAHVLKAAARAPATGPGTPMKIAGAAQQLGLPVVAREIATLEVVRGFGIPYDFDIQVYLDHALNVAVLAEHLATAEGADPDAAYLAGLLHELGAVALARFLPDTFQHLLAGKRGHSLHAACLERFGCHPTELSARLLFAWRLPDVPVRALQQLTSPEPGHADAAGRVADVVHQAHKICEAHGGAFHWDTLPDRTGSHRARQGHGGVSGGFNPLDTTMTKYH
ncbi:MAG: HDOD domain-containing protein [Myxococcales bacterium]|nr:HDOD domain-containing protein [Myxococcales bacterium]MDD9969994.1 HDOD domain-containing protein [Myxococcales bacterium]